MAVRGTSVLRRASARNVKWKKIKEKTAKKLDQRELIGRNWAKFTNLQDNLPLRPKKPITQK